MLEPLDYHMPTRLIYGSETCALVGSEVQKLGGRNVLVISDQGLTKAGLVKVVADNLGKAGLTYQIYDHVVEDPPIENVEEALKVYQDQKCDLIVAIGGGSVICLAKGVALLATNGGHLRDYEGFEKVINKLAPLIILPTTAGSGSEVSQFFIISDHDRHLKMAIGSPLVFPDLAILDPDLMLTLPYWQGIVSGLDALTHAIESCFSTRTSILTESLALEAIKIIFRNLLPASASRSRDKKLQMLLASVMANIACGNSRLGLVHATADPLSVYFHYPHGMANGLMLPFVLEYNLVAEPGQGQRILWSMSEGLEENETFSGPLACLKNLYLRAGFPLKIPADISERLDTMVSDVMRNFLLQTNARTVSSSDVRDLYVKAGQGW